MEVLHVSVDVSALMAAHVDLGQKKTEAQVFPHVGQGMAVLGFGTSLIHFISARIMVPQAYCLFHTVSKTN